MGFLLTLSCTQGGDLLVYDHDDGCDGHSLEPDAYTTSCMVFFTGDRPLTLYTVDTGLFK